MILLFRCCYVVLMVAVVILYGIPDMVARVFGMHSFVFWVVSIVSS